MTVEHPSKFDHGSFWDSYSKSWETQYEGQGSDPGSVLGNEWGGDDAAQVQIERAVDPYLNGNDRIVEIGPGGGKFSRHLAKRAGHLTLVDVSAEMLQRSSRTCVGNVDTLRIDGKSLHPIVDGTIDMVVSFDVFVHLETEEIFRYFAEVNRILKPGGIFSVDTKTFESRYGMMNWLRQLRGAVSVIGSRYGGRQYPLSHSVMKRLAANSGFATIDSHADWENSHCAFVFRKTTPAYVWRFVTERALSDRWEICDHLGGAGRRAIFAAQREDGTSAVLVMGEPRDPKITRMLEANLPHCDVIVPARRLTEVSGVCMVELDGVRGISLRRILDEPSSSLSEIAITPRHLGVFLNELSRAQAAGLAHGELSPDWVFADLDLVKLRTIGWVPAEILREDHEARVQQGDRRAVCEIASLIAHRFRWPVELLDFADSLACAPEDHRLRQFVHILESAG